MARAGAHLLDLALEDAGRPRIRVGVAFGLEDAVLQVPLAHRRDQQTIGAWPVLGITSEHPLDHAHRDRPRLPVDQRIRCAQVDRFDLARVDPLLTQRPGMSELDERARRRVGVAADLTVEAVEDRLGIAPGAVAHTQRLLIPCHQVGDQFVDRSDLWLGHLLDPAGYLLVHRVEDLALARIDHRHHHAVGVSARKRQQIERRDTDHRDPTAPGRSPSPMPGRRAFR